MIGHQLTAREMYQAYLRGDVKPEEIDKRARELNEARRIAASEPKPPKNDE